MKFNPATETSHAFRRLRRTPGFSLGVIALLAISIGGAAAVATAGYSLFAQPLPYHQPERLVTLSVFSKRFSAHMGLSPALVNELNESEAFGRIGIVDQALDLEFDSGEVLRAGRIDQHVLQVLGLAPVSGRLFSDRDVRPGAEPVALIGESLLARFDSARDAIGTVLETDAGRLRIVGVIPEAFAMPESDVAIWLPMELGPQLLDPETVGSFGNRVVIARTRQGETPGIMQQRLGSRLGDDPRMAAITDMLEAEYRVRPLRELWSGGEGQALMILGLALGLVLAASILNVAGMWMARWFGRSHALAIQSALGGQRRGVLAGAAIEYLLLAIPACLLALPVAVAGLEFLYDLEVLGDNGPLAATAGLVTAVIALVMVATAACPILLSLLWQTRGIAAAATRFLTGGGTAVRAHGSRLRQLLMIGQIGIACSLLLVLGLLFASWNNLLEEDVGIDRDRLVALHVNPVDEGPPEPDAKIAALAETLSGLPGVEAVSWASVVPFGRMEMVSSISLDGSGGEQVPSRPRSVGPDFFRVAGIGLLRGRRFGPDDGTDAADNVVVDQLFADQYMGGDALGESFGRADGPDRFTPVRIIGVVETVRHMSPDEEARTPTVYTYSDAPEAQVQLLLRTAVAPDSLVATVRNAAAEALGEARIGFVASLESLVRRTVRDREPQLMLMGVFAGLAVVLVFYGLYALQSYQVAARTAEFGLRKAMGAAGYHMIGQVLRQVLVLFVPGLLLGVAGGWLGARLVAERLYQVTPADPLLWMIVTAAVGTVIAVAALVPALRAARIAPMDALRYQ